MGREQGMGEPIVVVGGDVLQICQGLVDVRKLAIKLYQLRTGLWRRDEWSNHRAVNGAIAERKRMQTLATNIPYNTNLASKVI